MRSVRSFKKMIRTYDEMDAAIAWSVSYVVADRHEFDEICIFYARTRDGVILYL